MASDLYTIDQIQSYNDPKALYALRDSYLKQLAYEIRYNIKSFGVLGSKVIGTIAAGIGGSLASTRKKPYWDTGPGADPTTKPDKNTFGIHPDINPYSTSPKGVIQGPNYFEAGSTGNILCINIAAINVRLKELHDEETRKGLDANSEANVKQLLIEAIRLAQNGVETPELIAKVDQIAAIPNITETVRKLQTDATYKSAVDSFLAVYNAQRQTNGKR